jgi:hypothetical protein
MSELSRSEDARYDQGLLFTDGMPDLDDAAVRTADPLTASEVDYSPEVSVIVSFGQDAAGELYVVSLLDGIFRVTAH